MNIHEKSPFLNVRVKSYRKPSWFARLWDRNWDVIISFTFLLAILALLFITALFFVRLDKAQMKAVDGYADEMTAKNWPEDTYGPLESFNGRDL